MAISDYYKTLEVIEINNTSDGLGGFVEAINVIKTISGAIVRSSNKETKIAEKLTNKSYYYLYTEKGTGITENNIIRDGEKTYRITSLGSDRVTPSKATLNIEKFECEICNI